MGKDDQVAAFRLYDFNKSEEFKAHMQNVELPANPSERVLLKVKAKWFKCNIDPDFELDWLPGLQAPSQPDPPASAPNPPPPAAARAQQPQPAAAARAPGGVGAAAAGARTAQWQQGRRLNLAILQVLIVLFSFIYLQPLSRSWSVWAYSKLVMILVFSQGLKVHTAHGLPAAFSLDAIKAWLMRVLPTSDAQYFLLAFAAAGSGPQTAVLPPFLVLAMYSLMQFLADVAGGHPLWQRHGVHVHRLMLAKQQVALGFNAQSEIALGFLLLLGLPFPSRAPTFAFMAWQFLRMRYWSPDSAVYHRQAWAQLDQMTAQFRVQFPLLQRVVDFFVNFFNQAGPRHA